MKKFLSFFLLFSTILFSDIALAANSDYTNGYNWARDLKSKAGSEAQNIYESYLDSIIRPCTRISGSIYHAGDSRLPTNICNFTLGAYNGFYGTSRPLSDCTREAVPSDVGLPPDITNCSITGYTTCPAKTFSYSIGTINVDVDFEGNMPLNTVAFVPSNQEGNTCGQTTTTPIKNMHVECTVQAKCTNSGWQEMSKVCDCVSPSSSGFKGSVCTGTPPYNTGYCRCGKWVSWEKYRTTNEC